MGVVSFLPDKLFSLRNSRTCNFLAIKAGCLIVIAQSAVLDYLNRRRLCIFVGRPFGTTIESFHENYEYDKLFMVFTFSRF